MRVYSVQILFLSVVLWVFALARCFFPAAEYLFPQTAVNVVSRALKPVDPMDDRSPQEKIVAGGIKIKGPVWKEAGPLLKG
jgi:hypothetical protein